MTELVKRTLSGFVFVAAIIFTTMESSILFSLLFFFFSIVGALEFSRLQSISKYYVLPLAVGLFVIYETLPFFELDTGLFYVILGGFSFVVILYLLVFLFNSSMEKFSFQKSFVVYIGYILVPFILMILIQSEHKELMMSCFLMIWFNDTFAYLSGMNFGKNKLFPSISPKKTIEGFVGGLIMTVLASITLHKYVFKSVDFSLLNWVVFAIVISTFGTLGDLVQSKFKRIAGVKDSGNFMPGHGGVLDRLDSVIVVTPIVYILIKTIEYVQ